MCVWIIYIYILYLFIYIHAFIYIYIKHIFYIYRNIFYLCIIGSYHFTNLIRWYFASKCCYSNCSFICRLKGLGGGLLGYGWGKYFCNEELPLPSFSSFF